ncbi:MAG TPA: hypothetical protein VKA50_00685 [Gammaproteobacteria bacterium]|nr:hypothetical protein [Gammaproteobacteria bacterium]
MMNISKKIAIVLLLGLLALNVSAADKSKKHSGKSKEDVKELSGISVIGNKEAPKSLFIVPWKSSEVGVETGLASSLLNEKMKPVDKDVFMRELNFYDITVGKKP